MCADTHQVFIATDSTVLAEYILSKLRANTHISANTSRADYTTQFFIQPTEREYWNRKFPGMQPWSPVVVSRILRTGNGAGKQAMYNRTAATEGVSACMPLAVRMHKSFRFIQKHMPVQ